MLQSKTILLNDVADVIKIDYICDMENSLKKYKGIHPGLILNRILQKRSIRPANFARLLNTPRQNIYAICKGNRGLSISLSLKVDQALNVEEGSFALLQTYYALAETRKENQTAQPNLKKLRDVLFWDTDKAQIDWENQYKAVINRVFERGNATERSEITRFYGKEKVRKALSNHSDITQTLA